MCLSLVSRDLYVATKIKKVNVKTLSRFLLCAQCLTTWTKLLKPTRESDPTPKTVKRMLSISKKRRTLSSSSTPKSLRTICKLRCRDRKESKLAQFKLALLLTVNPTGRITNRQCVKLTTTTKKWKTLSLLKTNSYMHL